jgi:hypothetical protein
MFVTLVDCTGLQQKPGYPSVHQLEIRPSLSCQHLARIVELHRQSLVLLSSEFMTRKIVDECLASVGAELSMVTACWTRERESTIPPAIIPH